VIGSIGAAAMNRLEHDITVELSPSTGTERRRADRRQVDVDVAVDRRRGERRRGRPTRVAGERATARIWAFLTSTERQALDAVAHDNGLTVAQVIRDAVNEYVADYSDRRVFGISCTGKPAAG